MLLSITRTLYGVGFVRRILNERFPPSIFRQNGARCLRLPGSLPKLRLARMNANFTKVLFGVTTTTGDYPNYV
jgi:hypothetical protein